MAKKKIIAQNNLKFFRKKAGLTLQQLADMLGENYQNIQRYESMKRDLTMAMAQKIAPHLGLKNAAILFSTPKNFEYAGGGTQTSGLQSAEYTGSFYNNPDHKIPVYSAYIPSPDSSDEEGLVDKKECPIELRSVKNGFALQVTEEFMSPRYRLGDHVHVDPNKFPEIGQECVIVFKDGDTSIRRYIKTSKDTYHFEHYNPSEKFERNKNDIRDIYAIVGMSQKIS